MEDRGLIVRLQKFKKSNQQFEKVKKKKNYARVFSSVKVLKSKDVKNYNNNQRDEYNLNSMVLKSLLRSRN